MPATDGTRFDDDQALSPSGKAAAGENPEATICIPELWSGLTSLENNQLLPKAEVFGNQSCSGLENSGESIREAPNHQRGP